MKLLRKLSIGMAVTVGLVGAGSAAAFANTSATNFSNETIPAYQQSHYLAAQEKVNTLDSGIAFSAISGGNTMNVKAQNLQTGAEYSERYGLGTGTEYNIANGTTPGDSSRLVVTNNVWELASETVSGWFIIN